jgi:Helix-turn-helix domain
MVGSANLRTELPAAASAGPQTFAKENDRERLSPVATTAFLSLSKAWGLSNAEAAALIGVSASTLDRIKRGYRPTLSQDQLTRVSALVGVFKGLHLLFSDATADE